MQNNQQSRRLRTINLHGSVLPSTIQYRNLLIPSRAKIIRKVQSSPSQTLCHPARQLLQWKAERFGAGARHTRLFVSEEQAPEQTAVRRWKPAQA